MATQRIEKFNVSKFLAHARDVREQAVELLENEACVENIRQAYSIAMDESEYMDTAYVAVPNTAADLRVELSVAAGRAMQHGATESQINYIMALAEQSGDFSPIGCNLLTRGKASNIIDQMKREIERRAA